MRPWQRTVMFVVAGLPVLVLYGWAVMGLPAVGHYRGPYGDVIASVAVYQRHINEMVGTVTFDYRGFDTLGEEFIFFAAVVGGALLMRQQKDEEYEQVPDMLEGRSVPPPSDAVRVFAVSLAGALVVFGLYVVTHGHLTPGGGFQGGTILASTPLMLYLASDLEMYNRLTPKFLTEGAEAAGAAGFALIAISALFFGAALLTNIVPLGKTGNLFSAGTVPIINLSTGLEIAGGFVLVFTVFLEDLLQRHTREQGQRSEEGERGAEPGEPKAPPRQREGGGA